MALLVLEIGLRIAGSLYVVTQQHKNTRSLQQNAAFRILCLGESTTAGGANAYPALLEKILNTREPGTNFKVINAGVPAVDISYIDEHLESNIRKYSPNMIIIIAGINNEGRLTKVYGNTKLERIIKSLRIYKILRLLRNRVVYLIKSRAPVPKPKKGWQYFEEGKELYFQNKAAQAVDALKKVVKKNPRSAYFRSFLGQCYLAMNDFGQAESHFRKALELNPRSSFSCLHLGQLLEQQGRLSEAESLYKEWVKANPADGFTLAELGALYIFRGAHNDAEILLRSGITTENIRAYGILASIAGELKNSELEKKFHSKARDLALKKYNAEAFIEYRGIAERVLAKGIRLICAQYPVRSVDPLKKMLDGIPGIVFVSNEDVFKEALRNSSRTEYFVDLFAGDFGHCTQKGNELLAENIADSILDGRLAD
ncbi:MAG: tetratricopeptide repeat protein [Candidatus Omnitrophota bacterium]